MLTKKLVFIPIIDTTILVIAKNLNKFKNGFARAWSPENFVFSVDVVDHQTCAEIRAEISTKTNPS